MPGPGGGRDPGSGGALAVQFDLEVRGEEGDQGLAGLAGVLAAPFRAITADMGNNFAIILFAVVVIGGLGSIVGAVVAGFLVGLVEAFGQAYAPTFAQILIFVLMALIILVRPAGLFGRKEAAV